jgi:hypothetical protein
VETFSVNFLTVRVRVENVLYLSLVLLSTNYLDRPILRARNLVVYEYVNPILKEEHKQFSLTLNSDLS